MLPERENAAKIELRTGAMESVLNAGHCLFEVRANAHATQMQVDRAPFLLPPPSQGE